MYIKISIIDDYGRYVKEHNIYDFEWFLADGKSLVANQIENMISYARNHPLPPPKEIPESNYSAEELEYIKQSNWDATGHRDIFPEGWRLIKG